MPPITRADDPRYIKALSHPLRVRILGILEEQDASPVELSQVLDASLGTVSYHVRQLNELGLLDLVRETPRRGAVEHHYRAKPRPRSGGDAWESVSVIAKQAIVGAELQHTADVAQRAAAVGGFDGDHARLERLRLSLDDRGVQALSKALAKLAAEAQRIQEDCDARTPPRDGHRTEVGLVAMLFDAVGGVDPSAGRPAPTGARRPAARRRDARR
ncbi:MAG TPA: winged helix-turn-helix domain-containing protein [Baekduia sp.]|nr:winged helix-turn-helix domain-containing protein [Baekduia sp.]